MAHAADIIFHILNFIVAVVILIEGVFYCIGGGVLGFILGAYVLFFGVLIILFELKPPAIIQEAFGYFKWWIGRGLFYIFVGVLTYGAWVLHDWLYIGVIPIVVGIVYCILQFISGIEQPPLL